MPAVETDPATNSVVVRTESSDEARTLAAKTASSRELCQYYLDRIARLDPELNSFITVTESAASKIKDLLAERRAVFNQVSELTNRVKLQARQA